MSIMCELFGYITIGGSPSEGSFVRECMQWNRRVTKDLSNEEFWLPGDFRFPADETDHISLGTITVYKSYCDRKGTGIDDIRTHIRRMLTQLFWRSGLLIDYSIDRGMRGDPGNVEYLLSCDPKYDPRDHIPVGERIEIEVTQR